MIAVRYLATCRLAVVLPAGGAALRRPLGPQSGRAVEMGIVFRRRGRLPAAAPFRRAFTILEVVLILAILATIVGLAWPALDRLHAQYRLRQGGQLVQARLAGARVHAIDTGYVYQFLFEPGGQRFVVLPHDAQALSAAASAAPNTGGAASSASPGTGATRIPKLAGRLPSPNAHFDAASTGAAQGQQLAGEWLAGIPDAGDYSNATWSAPILFYPDGTASHAQLVLRDKNSQVVTVSIRALTGGISVSKIEHGGSP